MTPGKFIVFEGGEGVGKTTQIQLLHAYLTAQGISCLHTREPGGTPNAEAIRTLFTQGEAERWDSYSEICLVTAARRDHLKRLIWPALAVGQWVLCDRFLLSSLVYQGYVGIVPTADIMELYQKIAGDFTPDLTVVLDMPAELSLNRALERADSKQRFEKKPLAFHQQVRNGFLECAKEFSPRYVIIDARPDIATIAQSIHLQIQGVIDGKTTPAIKSA